MYQIGVFYDVEKEGVDFLIQKGKEEIIPIEVSIGKKGKSQINKAINKHKAKYGVVISNTNDIKREGNITYLPIMFFSFV